MLIKKLIISLLAVFVALLVFSCKRQEDDTLETMLEMESEGYSDRQISDSKVQDIKEKIEEYKGIVNRKVEAAGQLAIYYKMLATEYLVRDMYGLALENFSEAIRIETENPILFYYAGVCSARMGKAMVEAEDALERFRDAESYYLRAISLDKQYSDALYGLSVLYVFELNEAERAIPYLQRLLAKESKNTDALFLLARAYVEEGDISAAVNSYDRIIEVASSEEARREAQRNREILVGGSE